MSIVLKAVPSHGDWIEHTKKISLNTGIDMGYLEFGDIGRPVLLMIHGHSDSSRIWKSLIEALINDYHIYAIDLRGFGESSKPKQYIYSMSHHAEDILAFMDAMAIDSTYVIGHSMGSMIAQTLAYYRSDRVTKLMLAATMLRMRETPASLKEILAEFESLDIENRTDREIQDYLLPFPERCHDADFPAGLTESARKLSGDGLAAAWRAMSITDNRNFVQFIKAPTMVIWGEDDPIFTWEYQSEIKKFWPQIQFVHMTDVGHEIPSETPLELANLVKGFFA